MHKNSGCGIQQVSDLFIFFCFHFHHTASYHYRNNIINGLITDYLADYCQTIPLDGLGSQLEKQSLGRRNVQKKVLARVEIQTHACVCAFVCL